MCFFNQGSFDFRDTLIITTGNCTTSFFAGFAIFSILGHMAWRKGVPVGEVADTGTHFFLCVCGSSLIQNAKLTEKQDVELHFNCVEYLKLIRRSLNKH